jgi:hypothetical protein
MATSFGFTNTTASTKAADLVNLGVKSNYALVGEQPAVVELQNKTCPLDQGERITYRCQDVDKVSTAQTLQNPSKIRNGVQYVIKVEDILRTTDTNGDIIYDEPVVAYLTIRHQKTGTIQEEHIVTMLSRVLGACYDETTGKWRFADLMRSALQPTED